MKYKVIANVNFYEGKTVIKKQVELTFPTKKRASMVNQAYLDAGYESRLVSI